MAFIANLGTRRTFGDLRRKLADLKDHKMMVIFNTIRMEFNQADWKIRIINHQICLPIFLYYYDLYMVY